LGLETPTFLEIIFFPSNNNHWAASLAANNKTAETLGNMLDSGREQLRPSEDDTYHYNRFTAEIERVDVCDSPAGCYSGNISVPPNIFPSMPMAFVTYEYRLMFRLFLRNISSLVETHNMTPQEEEDYEWISTLTDVDETPRYSRTRTLRAMLPVFAYSSTYGNQKHENTWNLTHYLSPEARTPIFVNLSTVPELLQKVPTERDFIAPIAQPKVIRKEGQDVVRNRYFGTDVGNAQARQGFYYAGNTWLRKVVKPLETAESDAVGKLIIQS
jgi:hypothetical protein